MGMTIAGLWRYPVKSVLKRWRLCAVPRVMMRSSSRQLPTIDSMCCRCSSRRMARWLVRQPGLLRLDDSVRPAEPSI